MAKLVICPHEDPENNACGFQLQSEEHREVVELVQQHAHEEHDLTLTEADVKAMMQDI